MTLLQGKIALVTGSATGIGEAIARRLAQEGATLMIHGRESELETGEAIAQELPGAAFYAADVQDPEQCEALIAAVVERFGGIDILVNNAAVMTRSNIETTDVAVFDRTIAINVRAPLLLFRAALPHFRRAGGGRVLNIGSMNAYTGESNLLAYSVSKGALMTLSRNLADALCYDGVRVNHFNVGWVLTPNEYHYKIKDGLPKDWPEQVPEQFAPRGSLMKPEEIAAAAMYWLSDDSRPFSGSVVDLEQYPFVGRNPTKRGD
jgi:NAD(P)-dependent dehydrogenase (short-subunit alcohol dehydrogenase family)